MPLQAISIPATYCAALNYAASSHAASKSRFRFHPIIAAQMSQLKQTAQKKATAEMFGLETYHKTESNITTITPNYIEQAFGGQFKHYPIHRVPLQQIHRRLQAIPAHSTAGEDFRTS